MIKFNLLSVKKENIKKHNVAVLVFNEYQYQIWVNENIVGVEISTRYDSFISYCMVRDFPDMISKRFDYYIITENFMVKENWDDILSCLLKINPNIKNFN